MIHIERSTDYALIRGIMTHPAIYQHLTDDASPAAEDFRPIENDGLWYLVAWEGNELLGLWMLVPHNAVCWEIHTALLPDAWGTQARRAAVVMLDWVWRNTPCRRIVTNVPADNRLAFHFALEAGMEPYGTNEASFLKNGRLFDQICLGISRPRELPITVDCSPVVASAAPEEG
jgi:RimJ/RimL family protein N-acetyltransferase